MKSIRNISQIATPNRKYRARLWGWEVRRSLLRLRERKKKKLMVGRSFLHKVGLHGWGEEFGGRVEQQLVCLIGLSERHGPQNFILLEAL